MRTKQTMDGNTAAAYISYAFTEVAAIYPITPSSTMAELVDQWSAAGKKNLFNQPVMVTEMQSEAGAAGVVHGSLKAGALTTTYTASQGLLLMLPNMYKIAGECLPAVFHVASRSIATSALSIFGDHGDVMAARQTGFVMLVEESVQAVMDLSAVAHLAAIEASLPFLNFFDGFRTSHEVQKIEVLDYDELAPLINQQKYAEFKAKSMNPNHPHISGTNQNPDIHFQQRETSNQHYLALPKIVQKYMDEINRLRGTDYQLVNYYGAPDATEVIVSMGSVGPVIQQTVDQLNNEGRKVGHLTIHLYRPFPVAEFCQALPPTVKSVAVLDRTKEPGAGGEPLLLDVQSALYNSVHRPLVIGGRYGLGSKDVTPTDILAIFSELRSSPATIRPRFTVGIEDDVTHLSLKVGNPLDLTPSDSYQAKFWGFGSDGTVGASKATLQIVGDATDKYVQGYFDYDSKKAGGLTTSHLRFSAQPIRSAYLVQSPDFVACHSASYLQKYQLLAGIKPGGIFLINTTFSTERLKKHLPTALIEEIIAKNVRVYTIDAVSLAQQLGLGKHINTIMQTAFFAVSQILPLEQAIPLLKDQVEKNYGRKSAEIVAANQQAIEQTVERIQAIDVTSDWLVESETKQTATSRNGGDEYSQERPPFVFSIVDPIERQAGNQLTVGDLKANNMTDGRTPLGTAAFEKRGIALEVPVWDVDKCTMCNECAFVCPHAAIRPFLVDEEEAAEAPEGFLTKEMRGADGLLYRIQVSLEDCTGCGLCVEACPAKGKALELRPYEEAKEEARNWAFAMTLKTKANPLKKNSVRGSQFEKPLFEFSGACSGCGETPYIKLLTQLYGDRLMIANATGCSSIYGGAMPTTPYTTNDLGEGPAWSNSLFEDNAEYGFGMHLANETRRKGLAMKVQQKLAKNDTSPDLTALLSDWLDHFSEKEGTQQRAHKVAAALAAELDEDEELAAIMADRDLFVKPSQWIVGGDGWAYDIGFGGLDHVLASGADVNILVMDNEVYSNTGGQKSKATPMAAVAKFAADGKRGGKKDLGVMAMSYEHVYVAQIASGANQLQTLKAFEEAEQYPGPSLIIAYSPCVVHGITTGIRLQQTKNAVETGYWSLYRYNPQLRKKGKNPMILDYKKPNFKKLKAFLQSELRFSALQTIDKQIADDLYELTVTQAKERFYRYARIAGQEEKIREKLEKEND